MKSFARSALFVTLAAQATACHVYREELLPAGDASRDTNDAQMADVPPDVLTGCAALIAQGKACVEPLIGHGYNVDDPRITAPYALHAVGGRVFVGDLGTGRILSYTGTGTAPMRQVGNGLTGTITGTGTVQGVTPGAIRAITTLGGDVVFADAGSHGVFRARNGNVELFVNQVFTSGPEALVSVDQTRMLMVQNNQIFLLDQLDTQPRAQAIIGQGCGLTCRGFNAAPAVGTQTQLNFPTGVSSDPTGAGFYIADSLNCRIRKAGPNAPYMTTVFSGAGCNPAGSPIQLGAGNLATNARTGVVGDVVAHLNGSVYFTDTSHCAILAVNTVGGTAGQIRLVAGSLTGCNDASGSSIGNVPLGPIGRLSLSEDGNTLYFVDARFQRVGAVMVGNESAGPTFPIDPGVTPGPNEPLANFRPGGIGGLAAVGGLGGSLLVSGPGEGKVYRVEGSAVTTFLGKGTAALNVGLPIDSVLNMSVNGLAVSGDALATATVVFGVPDHHLIGRVQGISAGPLAGQYDSPGMPMGMPTSPTDDRLTNAAWPVITGTTAYFTTGGAQPQLMRVDNIASPTASSIQVLAGAATGGSFASSGPVSSLLAKFGPPAAIAVLPTGDVFIADPAHNVVWKHQRSGTLDIAVGLFDQPTAGMSDEERGAKAVSVGQPVALAYDGGERLFIADALANRIRVVNLNSNNMRTVAGSGPSGTIATSGDGGDALLARFATPSALVWLGNNQLLVGEQGSGRVRVVTLP